MNNQKMTCFSDETITRTRFNSALEVTCLQRDTWFRCSAENPAGEGFLDLRGSNIYYHGPYCKYFILQPFPMYFSDCWDPMHSKST